MSPPSSRSGTSEAGAALSSAHPGFARRMGRAEQPHDGGAVESRGAPVTGFAPPKKRLSLLKRIERYVSSFLKLGRTYGTVKDITRHQGLAGAQVDALSHDITALRDWRGHVETRLDEVEGTPRMGAEECEAMLEARIGAVKDDMAETLRGIREDAGFLRTDVAEKASGLSRRIAAQAAEQASIARAYTDLTRRLDLARAGAGPETAASPAPETTGLDALTESFYARLEDRYRGSREEIGKRLLKYLPDAEVATERTGKPVLDLGCGRGEWIEVLRARGMEASGVDLNEMQLREARDLGLDVHLGDACRFLADAPDGAYGMITAHHLVEHLPFETVVWMTRETLRVLAPGGVLLYETPNPQNVVVGASSFHVDPTHLRPLPAQVLTTLLDTVGFHPVESRLLHPHPKCDELIREDRLDPEIANLLFGPQDLAVLGTKPEIGG